MKYDKAFRKLFWSKIDRPKKGCWNWKVGTGNHGYGQFQCSRVFGPRKKVTAHRVAWELAYGEIPAGMHVLHECDNHRCCRPSHFFLGTQVDNNKDRDSKGRTAKGDRTGARTMPHKNPFVRNRGSGLKGEDHPRAKITMAIARKIRKRVAAGETQAALGREFGVCRQAIWSIIKNETWKENNST